MPYTEMVVVWSGVTGLPGYSKFRFIGSVTGSALTSAATNLSTMLTVLKPAIPTLVTWTIQPGVSVHADDGTLLTEDTIPTPPAAIVGTGAGAYSSASGFYIRWNTGAINGGHKVVGRTYFVPVTANILQADGTIIEASRTAYLTAAQAFATSTPSPAINSRARPGNPLAGNQTIAIQSANIPDKQVVLRSRRD